MILLWLPPGHEFTMVAARPWFYCGCRQAMIWLWLPPGHDFNMAAARPWFYYVCGQATILICLLPGHDFNMYDFIKAWARPWYHYGCCQAMYLPWLPPGHNFMAAAGPWFNHGRCRRMIIIMATNKPTTNLTQILLQKIAKSWSQKLLKNSCLCDPVRIQFARPRVLLNIGHPLKAGNK